jgi:hypothetical protein
VAVLVIKELHLDDVVDEIVWSYSNYDVLAQLQVFRIGEAGMYLSFISMRLN